MGIALSPQIALRQTLEVFKMMDSSWVDWFPIVLLPLKIIVLGVGMFYAIKWHHDQAKKDSGR